MSETLAPSAPTEGATRRCWRCLQTFPDAQHVPTREGFWLCEPCDTTLLPSKRRRS
jgi:hypothetical protein